MEQIQVKGAEVAEVIRPVSQGNVRRIRVLQDGKVLLEFQLRPVSSARCCCLLALIGAVAMVARCTIEVERVQEPRDSDSNITPPSPTEPEAYTSACRRRSTALFIWEENLARGENARELVRKKRKPPGRRSIY